MRNNPEAYEMKVKSCVESSRLLASDAERDESNAFLQRMRALMGREEKSQDDDDDDDRNESAANVTTAASNESKSKSKSKSKKKKSSSRTKS